MQFQPSGKPLSQIHDKWDLFIVERQVWNVPHFGSSFTSTMAEELEKTTKVRTKRSSRERASSSGSRSKGTTPDGRPRIFRRLTKFRKSKRASNEVKRKIASQQRAASISSVVVALLIMLLVFLLLYVINLTLPSKDYLMEVSYVRPPGNEEEDQASISRTKVEVARKPTPPGGGAPSRVISALTSSPVAVPVAIEASIDQSFGLSEDLGLDDDKGFGGGDFGNLPGGAGKRCNAEDRLKRVIATGGTKACEEAVFKALRYLKGTQQQDGSWNDRYRVGITGLALLAYLGHCETPVSGEFGETVFAATAYLVDRGMRNKGRLFDDGKSHWCYEHAIATYALCESYLFSRSFGYQVPNLETVVRQAVEWILNTQNNAGSWGYQYGDGPRFDTSITAWHLQALKAAKASGIKFSRIDDVINKGLKSLTISQTANGGFAYQPTESRSGNFPLTGAGVLCLQQHRGKRDFDARQGIGYISKHSRFHFKKGANLYEHYYVSQAAMNEGGDFWKSYNKMFRDQLLSGQNADGSWPSPPGNRHSEGIIYDTCLATLMLEVYYRYLPGTAK